MNCSENKLYESFFPMDYEKLYPFLHQNFFRDKSDGVFVEFGAHNGLGCTKYFEDLGWQGICMEPHPMLFEELKKNRKAICLNCAISNENKSTKFLQINYPGPDCLSGIYNKYDPRHVKRIQYELAKDGGTTKMINVDCRIFNDVMRQHNISKIDLLSIDTEGGELGILQTIDLNQFDIDVIVVENNYKESKLPEFMISHGYNFVIRTGPDEIFKRLVFP